MAVPSTTVGTDKVTVIHAGIGIGPSHVFEGVAPALAQRLAEVVRGLKDAGMTVILSESDLQHSERLVDRVVSIDRGALSPQ